MSEIEYRFAIRPLTAEEGGGYLIEFPDLPGCMSDGETIEEALANGAEAKRDWIAAMREAGRQVPLPSADDAEAYSGKWVLRTPKSLHRGLAERARQEGVSLNALAVAMLAQGLGQRTPTERMSEWQAVDPNWKWRACCEALLSGRRRKADFRSNPLAKHEPQRRKPSG